MGSKERNKNVPSSMIGLPPMMIGFLAYESLSNSQYARYGWVDRPRIGLEFR
ncbi:hypothetical protein OROHE_023520 [Orobanche hederae]